MNSVPPLLLSGQVQHYSWGKKGRDSLISRLLESVDDPAPFAELWIGAHPKAPSLVIKTPQAAAFSHIEDLELQGAEPHGLLPDVIMSNPIAILGNAVVEHCATLPFLVKVISVGTALSIQAHPARSQAISLHKAAPEHYPDSNEKSELTVAITPVSLLHGFRSRERIMADFARIPECLGYLDESLQQTMLLSPRDDRELLSHLFNALLYANPSVIREASTALVDKLTALPERTTPDNWVLKLAADYPEGDAGLFCFYLLNYETLLPGEGLFILAGTPHAYLEGDLLECLSNSDNVARAGLTSKHRDVDAFLEMINFTAAKPRIIKASKYSAKSQTSSVWRSYLTPPAEFALDVLQGANIFSTCKTDDLVTLIFSLDAHGTLHAGNSELPLKPGTAILIPADIGDYEIGLGSGTIFRTRPGLLITGAAVADLNSLAK